jgi:hypothetical protein
MAYRTWGKLLLTPLVVSVLAGAGQLGVAYGFGIVRLTGDFTEATVNRWPAQLVWVGWFAALAAVAGAVATERLSRADTLARTTTGQLAVAGAAALGATVVAPLCMQPARAAELNSVDPVLAVGICATLGAVVGALAALAVLLRPPLGWNVAALTGAVWFVGLVSSLPALVGTGPLPTVRLGVLEPGWLGADAAQRLATLVLPLVALLAGVASGALARRRGHPPLIGGASGAAGPVLVAFAYLAAGPGDSSDRYQLAPYYGALIAVATGVLGATAATLARWPLVARTGPATDADGPGAAIEPSDILAPLPSAPTAPADAAPASRTAEPATAATDPAGGDSGDGGSPAGATRLVPATVGAPPPHPAATDPTPGGAPAHWEWPATTEAGTPPTGSVATPTEPTEPEAADPHPTDSEADATGSRLRRGLFRRNRARPADDAAPVDAREDRTREPEPLPAQDEEYVDWVTGLSRPAPGQDSVGRHHRDT